MNRKLVIPVILVLALGAALYGIFRDRGVPSGDPSIWDKDRAFTAAMPVLQKTDWKAREGFCSTEACKPVHQLFGDFPITQDGKEKRVLVTTSIEEGSDCHACGPEVSLFEFEPGSSGWTLTDSDVDVVRWGQWGQLGRSELQILSLGKNVYGARLAGASTGQGVTLGITSIYAYIDGDYRKVFELQTSENDDSTRTSWDSAVSLQPGSGEFLDILVERKGNREGTPFSERELFKFNGTMYEPSAP